jgi:DNA-binding HxlR family transcriptional regulator
MRRFVSLGYIAQARAPYSAFQKQSRHTYWALTEKGEEFLSQTLVVRKALQEWVYKEKHVQRSAARKFTQPNFD